MDIAESRESQSDSKARYARELRVAATWYHPRVPLARFGVALANPRRVRGSKWNIDRVAIESRSSRDRVAIESRSILAVLLSSIPMCSRTASLAVSFMLDPISSLRCSSTVAYRCFSDASPFLNSKAGTWCAARGGEIRIAKRQPNELDSSASAFDWSLGCILGLERSSSIDSSRLCDSTADRIAQSARERSRSHVNKRICQIDVNAAGAISCAARRNEPRNEQRTATEEESGREREREREREGEGERETERERERKRQRGRRTLTAREARGFCCWRIRGSSSSPSPPLSSPIPRPGCASLWI